MIVLNPPPSLLPVVTRRVIYWSDVWVHMHTWAPLFYTIDQFVYLNSQQTFSSPANADVHQVYFQVHCTQLNADYEFIMKSVLFPSNFLFIFSVINYVSFSDLLFLTLFFYWICALASVYLGHIMHFEFSLPAQFLVYPFSEPSASSKWQIHPRKTLFESLNPSAFLIKRHNYKSRNLVTSRARVHAVE